MSIRRTTLGLAVVLAAASPADARAQAQPAQPATQAQAERAQAEQAPPETPPERQRHRPAKKAPRKSTRQSSSFPQGSYEEARPSRVAGPTREELNLTSSFLAGYDDNLTAGFGTGAGTLPGAMPSGSTASADATLGYYRGNNLRSIHTDATGTLQAYPGSIEHPAAGGTASVKGQVRIGRNLALGGSQRVGYEPFFSVFSTGTSSVPLPPGVTATTPVTGLYERRSWNTNSGATLERRWGRRDWTTLAYSYNRQDFNDGPFGNNSGHTAGAEHRHAFSRGMRLRAEYRFMDGDYWDSDALPLPRREHRFVAGPEIEKPLSRARQLTLSLSAGVSHVESVNSVSGTPWSSWVPTGSASLMVKLESWSVEGGYRRDFLELRGVSDELYATDTAYVATTRSLTTRTELRVAGTYSDWKTPVASGVNNTLNVYGATLQIRHMLSERLAATAHYYYYHHRYSNPGVLPAGFPAEYDRSALRVGLAISVPLRVTPIRSSSPPAAR